MFDEIYNIVGKLDHEGCWEIEPKLKKDNHQRVWNELKEEFETLTLYPRTDAEKFTSDQINSLVAQHGEIALQNLKNGFVMVKVGTRLKNIRNKEKRQNNIYKEVTLKGLPLAFETAMGVLARYRELVTLDEPKEKSTKK
jgi:hypothetical protein